MEWLRIIRIGNIDCCHIPCTISRICMSAFLLPKFICSSLHNMNLALLAKLGWKLQLDSDFGQSKYSLNYILRKKREEEESNLIFFKINAKRKRENNDLNYIKIILRKTKVLP